MLSLQLKSGEYITIGEDIVVQVFEESGSSFRLSVKAPREVPILRGAVLERTAQRPDGLHSKRPKSPSDKLHGARQLEAYAAHRERAAAEAGRAAREQAAVAAELQTVCAQLDGLRARLADSLPAEGSEAED